ncbi:MAG: Rv3235 family protein [Candidatus Nanopelagicaceae bacterium]|nr:Rv3235 family protein [Candidatus Nanopelagicaceae bacterium]
MTHSSITVRPITMLTASSIEPELWSHPMLDLYRREPGPHVERAPMLYSMPSQFGEEYDPEFAPQPTSATQLPDLRTWTLKFGVSVLEIWAAKRQPAQLSRWCHQTIYSELVKKVGSQQEVGRIRKLHQCEPLDGISESTITVRFEKRVRSIALRFEGVDHRWLCTSLTLL